MKKILSILLVAVMLICGFAVTASAEYMNYDYVQDGIYYVTYDDIEACIVACDIQTATDLVVPETVSWGGNTYTVTDIENQGFYMTKIKSVTLPKTITVIGDGAFSSCQNLIEVNIDPETEFEYFGTEVFFGSPVEGEFYSQDVTILGKNVLFAYCGTDKEYTIPDDITILADACFMYSGIEKVNFNDSITEISPLCFASCHSLTEFTVPDTIESIGNYAFKDCTNLASVTLGKNVVSLAVECFANTKLKTIHLTDNVASIYGTFAGCNTLESVTVSEDNTCFEADETALYEVDGILSLLTEGKALALYYPQNDEAVFNIPDDVTAIYPYAFYYNKYIKTVNCKDIFYMGEYSFNGTPIESLNNNSILFVGDYAFRNCKKLNKIDLSETLYIGSSAFEGCEALTNVDFSDSISVIGGLAFRNTGLVSVEISGDEVYVEEGAFRDCKYLKSINFGEGVYSIGAKVVDNCPNLETVTISKTVKEFDDNAFTGCEKELFKVYKGTKGFKYIKNLGLDYEVIGRVTIFEKILNLFRSLFGLL